MSAIYSFQEYLAVMENTIFSEKSFVNDLLEEGMSQSAYSGHADLVTIKNIKEWVGVFA